jgi:hypothetical protein
VRDRPRGAAEAAGAALGIGPGWDRRPGALGLVVLRLFRPDGAALVRAAAEADYAEVTGADALEPSGGGGGSAVAGEEDVERRREARHDFADLMRDVADSAAELDGGDRMVLAAQLDRLLQELRALGAEVWPVAASRGPGRTLHVEVRAADAPPGHSAASGQWWWWLR